MIQDSLVCLNMNDPIPENISGSKVYKHEFSHSIQWGYLVLGIALLYLAWRLGPAITKRGSSEHGGD